MQNLLNVHHFLCLCIVVIGIFLKLRMWSYIQGQWKRNKIQYIPYFTLLIILVGQIITDLSWSLYMLRLLYFEQLAFLVRCIVRLAWIVTPFLSIAFSYLAENLIFGITKFSIRQKICVILSSLLAITGISFIIISPWTHHPLEFIQFRSVITFYDVFVLIIPSFFIILFRLLKYDLPYVLQNQIETLLSMLFVLISLKIFDLTAYCHPALFELIVGQKIVSLMHPALMSIITLYFALRLHRLRFLNLTAQISSSEKKLPTYQLLNDVTLQLSNAKTIDEALSIAESFLKHVFSIPSNSIQTFFADDSDRPVISEIQEKSTIIFSYFKEHKRLFTAALNPNPLLVYHELHYSLFWGKNSASHLLAEMLEAVDAEIMIPITSSKNELLGFILVTEGARPTRLYTENEQELLSLFGAFLRGHMCTIHLAIKMPTFAEIQKQRNDLYEQTQRIQKIGEGLRYFANALAKKQMGLITFQDGQFKKVNDDIDSVLSFDLNKQRKEPLAIELFSLAQRVAKYKKEVSITLKDSDGTPVYCDAVFFHPDKSVIFVLSRPVLRNFITPTMLELTEPKSIDCLFSLQTTTAGRLINEAIPTNEEPLLSLKLALMHAVLTNHSYWIDGHDQDCDDMIELINKASAKPLSHTITVTKDCDSNAFLLEFFGIDSIAIGVKQTPALLQKLDKIGTLYIKNIDYLSFAAQEKIAQFIETGRIEQRYIFNPTWYDIRLFCSGSAPFAELLRAGRLHKKLQEVIETAKICIPSVSNISVKAADDFIKETAKRFLTQEGTNIVLTLNTHEREKIRKGQSIFTLSDLRKETGKFLESKSKHIFGHTDTIAPIETLSGDQLILHAATLGKQAIHDRKTMAALWLRLKSQQRIAEILRVNRSTVWRALKKFDIKQDEN